MEFIEILVAFNAKRKVDLSILDKDGNNLAMIAIIIEKLLKTEEIFKKAFLQKLIDLDYVKTLSRMEQASFMRDNEYILKNFPIVRIIKELLPNYNPNYLNKLGENALMLSADACLLDIFNLLKDKTDIYHKSNDGRYILNRVVSCSSKEYLPLKPKSHEYSIKYNLLINLHDEILKSIDELIKAENKDFLINLVHIYVDENLIDELIEIINNIESNVGYSLNVNVKNLIANYQNSIPKVLSKNTQLYSRSKRPLTEMKRLINKKTLPKLPKMSSIKILNNFDKSDESCFCLEASIGLHRDVFIPILRYGKSATHGYYGTLTGQQYVDAEFTWYYIDPDSDILLHGDNILVARNKIQAVVLLDKLCKETLGKIGKSYIEYKIIKLLINNIDEYLKDIRYELETDEELMFIEDFMPTVDTDNPDDYYIGSYRINKFMENEENKIYNSRYTNYFRSYVDISSNEIDKIYFAGGLLDYLDETIHTLARKLNIDIVILTHQSGNSGRLVSELLDTRKRSVSFANLYLN